MLEIKNLMIEKHDPLDYTKLSELQKERIQDSESQIENGDLFTNEQVDKIIDKLLEEQTTLMINTKNGSKITKKFD